MIEYKCEREGTHFVAVDPKDTTKGVRLAVCQDGQTTVGA